MVQVKDLTELTVTDLWKEVKEDEEAWWEDTKEEQLRALKGLLQSAMEADLLERLQAGHYRRTELRRGYRNGYRHRSLMTELGVIEHLRVPRDREGCFQPRVLARYQRRQSRVNRLIREMFLAGVSTRRIGEVLSIVLGEKPSAQTVSRVLRSLDGEVRRFHSRRLLDRYRYLVMDGIVLKVKGMAKVSKRVVLCLYGITHMGGREIVSFRQAYSEAESQWEAFLRDLYQRGLEGKTAALVATDGSKGLHLALDTVYPYVPRQRCWVHKLRNVASKLRRKDQAACLKGASAIYMASTRRDAVARFKEWAGAWRSPYSNAVECIEQDLDELLNFLDCPVEHRRKIRTTNAIERSFREVRRRTRPMSCFQNGESVDRIIYGVLSHLNSSWRDRPVWKSTHNT